jgi:hypothetical protein
VELFWPAERSFYRGTVTEFDAKSGEHRMEYDDGEVEWVGGGPACEFEGPFSDPC